MRAVVVFFIKSWARGFWLLGVHPTLVKTATSGAECAKFNTLALSKGAVLLNLVETLADGGVVGVVDIDVCSGAGSDTLDFLVARPLVTAIERNSHLHRLLHQNSAFDLVFLLFISMCGVLARRRVVEMGLLCEGSVQLVLPEVATLSGAHEGAGSVHLVAVRAVHGLDHGVSLTGSLAGSSRSFLIFGGVVTGTREVLRGLDCASFLAVGNLGEEDRVFTLGIELLLLHSQVFILVILSWAGVLFSRESVMTFIFRRPQFPLHVR